MDDLFTDESFSEYREKKQRTEKISEAKMEEYKKIVSFSTEMTAYIKEMNHVASTLKSIDSMEQFFEKSLLVSIDDGWGYSEFLQVIRKELMAYYEEITLEPKIKEENYPSDKGIGVWEKKIEDVTMLTERLERFNGFAILSYDMRNWMNEFSNPTFLQYIRKIGDKAKNILIVFRIPSLDGKVVKKIEDDLSNVISMRTIAVTPASIENMVEYMKVKLEEASFSVSPDCNELLEQWIYQERFDEHFYGYKTLDKMVNEVIYQKVLHSKGATDNKEDITNLKPEDIQMMLVNPIEVQDPYKLLEELVGLAQLKTKVKELVVQLKFQKELVNQGKEIERPSLHMMFTGNPGTGKTTVARIIGQIFKQEGLLRKGHFIEIMGGNFVTGNISTTLQKVRSACREAYGSVLFIDEAYSMSVSHSSGNVTDEILPILVTEMENHREDLCVIFAGYKEEMDKFLKENSGLRSRIPHVLEFPNYSKEELMEIFFHMLKGNFEYEDALKETLKEYMESIPEAAMEEREFSNARFVRNLYERLWGKAAYRASESKNAEVILSKEDLAKVIEEEEFHALLAKKKRRIGYIN